MAEVLKLLGTEHAMIVHSQGLDEIRLDAPTKVVELKQGEISTYEIHPTDFDLAERSADEVLTLTADSTESSLKLVKQSLKEPDSLAADIVSLNAGAAIYTAGITANLAQGVSMAQDAIAAGLAHERLSELVRVSKMMLEP